MSNAKKGQGAQHNPHNQFIRNEFVENEYCDAIEKDIIKPQYIEVFPKSIVNKVTSPDLAMDYSMNPYQGCEHGCSYCYARPTHEFWSYSAGIDFERKILIKKNAPQLLQQFFEKKNYSPKTIALAGNTDCYQPCEKEFKLTRQLLQVFVDYKHPVGLITKNSLILRDLDLLIELNKLNLVLVAISITTLNEDLRQKMEPRTATIKKRLETIKTLSENGIPVMVMAAPIIPGLNSHEILDILKFSAQNGARNFGYTIARLNDSVYPIFFDWLKKTYPMRYDRVLNQVSELHGGQIQDKRFGTRMKGEGVFAQNIAQTFKIGQQKYFPNPIKTSLATHHFTGKNPNQLKLF